MFIKKIKNPRSPHTDVRLSVEYNPESDEPIELRMALPWGFGDYVAHLNWTEWEQVNAWLHAELLEHSRG